MKTDLFVIYELLVKHYGKRNWWPADTKDEIVIGSILTQNVSWSNVRKALINLKNSNINTVKDIIESDPNIIAELIKPTRFYNQKTSKLINFGNFFKSKYNYSYEKLFKQDIKALRQKLLNINGIGKETADSIMLYAGNMPIFVCDAYTARILTRLGISNGNWKYDHYQKIFMDNLPLDFELFNDYHAQLCHLGSSICKTKPICIECPLVKICNEFNVVLQ